MSGRGDRIIGAVSFLAFYLAALMGIVLGSGHRTDVSGSLVWQSCSFFVLGSPGSA